MKISTPDCLEEAPFMTRLVRIAAAAVMVASFSSGASAQDCRELRGRGNGWAWFYCLAQNDPDKYTRCRELSIERGYSNIAPGWASFVMTCMLRPGRASASARRSQRDSALFDHLIGAAEQRQQRGDAERRRCRQRTVILDPALDEC
ncbi:hypothetical protein [Bradyrhizobium lablabi]|uniref:hypothetical protein n=1 Tax=Bradyrhizobium lablabi TaxID=722472 RepID=UPI0012AB3ECE|nr:hypothetical protein [Bradyrhizobium lablabi]